jgi:uncharacterized RDD family membrane protein YckC
MKDPIAQPGQRIIAGLIDSAIGLFLIQVLLGVVLGAEELPVLMDNLLLVLGIGLFILPILMIVFNCLLITDLGGTLGKLATGLEIVRGEDGERVSFKRAFFRNQIGYFVSGMILWAGFFWILVNRERRGWHDQIADTYVVVKHSWGYSLGLAVLIIVLAVNVMIGASNLRLFAGHSSFYRSTLEDIGGELQKAINTGQTGSDNSTGTNPLPLRTPMPTWEPSL